MKQKIMTFLGTRRCCAPELNGWITTLMSIKHYEAFKKIIDSLHRIKPNPEPEDLGELLDDYATLVKEFKGADLSDKKTVNGIVVLFNLYLIAPSFAAKSELQELVDKVSKKEVAA